MLQCSEPCHNKTYDNETQVLDMVKLQKNMKIPTELIPKCPVCGKPMSMNLRSDDTFVEDEGWHIAARRYKNFLNKYKGTHILFLELGVGYNTPGIIKFPFWNMTMDNPNAVYACLNFKEIGVPQEIEDQTIIIDGDICRTLNDM